MHRGARCNSLSLLLVALLSSLLQPSSGYLLVGNGEIYTVVATNPIVEAMAIEGNKIVAVGTVEALRNSLGPEEKFWNLDGRLVLPGFQDVHVHAVEAGINSEMCHLPEDTDLYDIAKKLRNCKRGGKFGDQGWIVGMGIDLIKLLDAISENNYDWPIKVLDDEFPDTPVLVLDNLGRSALVNTAAFENSTMFIYYDKDPDGGMLDRDENGEVVGIVRENAHHGFRNAAFPPTESNKQVAYDGLLRSMPILASFGITSICDIGGFWKQAQTEAWDRAEAEGKMLVRASNAFYIYPDVGLGEQLFILQSRFTNEKDKLVRFNQATIYVDGILPLGTAALNEPYEDFMALSSERELGFEYLGSQANLEAVVNTIAAAGYQLNLLVTGDRAATMALDAIVSLSYPGTHRLTHLNLVDEADRTRFAELGVVADFQMAPSSFDPSYSSFIADAIGATRASELLPIKEVASTGALVTLSSGWDADELDPLVKLKRVLTRPGGKAISSLDTAIRMMTINAATALQQDDTTGSIQAGKFADFIILSRNIFNDAVEDIDRAEILVTVMNGERTYDPDGLYGPKVGSRPNASGVESCIFVSFSFVLAVGLSIFSFLDASI